MTLETIQTPIYFDEPAGHRSVFDAVGDKIFTVDDATINGGQIAHEIVRAVNSFEKLVEALQRIKADCEAARTDDDRDVAVIHAKEWADAALQLAEAGTVAATESVSDDDDDREAVTLTPEQETDLRDRFKARFNA